VDPAVAAVGDAAGGAAPGLDRGRLAVSVSRAGGQGDPVTVTVGYEDHVVVPFVRWLFPSGSVSMHSTTVARQEFP
jgi:hypothetical protein